MQHMAQPAPTWRAALDALRAVLDAPLHNEYALVQTTARLTKAVRGLQPMSGEARHQSLRAELKG